MSITEDSIDKILAELIKPDRDDYAVITDWALANATQAIEALIKEARREELKSLINHREFIYWGDGSPSDLDKYLEDRLNQEAK